MWIICDNNDKVVDRSSSSINLSRGYLLAGVAVGDVTALETAGYHRYELLKKLDLRINDWYDGDKVTVNTKYRAGVELSGVESGMVELYTQKAVATTLGFTNLGAKLTTEYDALESRKGELDAIIAT